MPKVTTAEGVIPHVSFEEYKDKYKDHFSLERSESGVLMAKWHTNGDSLVWDLPVHRAIHQLATDVGQDVETEVFILAGTGANWILAMNLPEAESDPEARKWLAYEHYYYDGANLCEGLVNDIEVPTIGVINGPGFHTEMALFCDITIMSEDAVIFDPHYYIGAVPGDGIQIAFRMAMGYKRANYAMLTCQPIDARMALEYGMVNEVLPKDKVYERAMELGEELAKQSRVTRRVTTQVLRAPLKVAMAQELRSGLGSEMFSYLATEVEFDGDGMDAMKMKLFTDLTKAREQRNERGY